MPAASEGKGELRARPAWLSWLLAIAAVVYLALRLLPLASGGGQNDLRGYYFAGRAWSTSVDPYDPAAVDRVSGESRPVPFFVYPPSTLPLFGALQALSLPAARRLFLALELAALAGLVLVWRRMYPVD